MGSVEEGESENKGDHVRQEASVSDAATQRRRRQVQAEGEQQEGHRDGHPNRRADVPQPFIDQVVLVDAHHRPDLAIHVVEAEPGDAVPHFPAVLQQAPVFMQAVVLLAGPVQDDGRITRKPSVGDAEIGEIRGPRRFQCPRQVPSRAVTGCGGVALIWRAALEQLRSASSGGWLAQVAVEAHALVGREICGE